MKAVKKKIKKPFKKTIPAVPEDYFLMLPVNTTAEDIKDALSSIHTDVEIWPEVEVLEVILAEKLSMDIEKADMDLDDETILSFAEKENKPSIFYLTLRAEGYEKGLPLMKRIVQELDGVIVADTEDLTPVIRPEE